MKIKVYPTREHSQEEIEEHNRFMASQLKKKLDEGYKVTAVKQSPENKRRPKAVITTVFGDRVTVNIRVYEKRYKPYGFVVIDEIF